MFPCNQVAIHSRRYKFKASVILDVLLEDRLSLCSNVITRIDPRRVAEDRERACAQDHHNYGGNQYLDQSEASAPYAPPKKPFVLTFKLHSSLQRSTVLACREGTP